MPILKDATRYTIDSDSRLFREGKRLLVRRTDNGVFGRVVYDDGSRRRLNLARQNSGGVEITTEFVFEKEMAKSHPEYPDYAVTDYGVVYCLKMARSGIHANTIYIVPDFFNGPTNKRYISVRRPDGKRRQIRLAVFVYQAWGDSSRFGKEE